MNAGETTRALEGVCACADGDRPVALAIEDLSAVVRRYKPSIHATCLRLLRDRALAIEVTRDVVRAIYLRLPELGAAVVRARSWILDVTIREVFGRVRIAGELLLEDGVVPAGSAAARRLADLSSVERRDAVARAAAEVGPALRRAVCLRYAERLPWPTIDAVLDRGGSHALVQGARGRFAGVLIQQLA